MLRNTTFYFHYGAACILPVEIWIKSLKWNWLLTYVTSDNLTHCDCMCKSNDNYCTKKSSYTYFLSIMFAVLYYENPTKAKLNKLMTLHVVLHMLSRVTFYSYTITDCCLCKSCLETSKYLGIFNIFWVIINRAESRKLKLEA